MTVDFILYILNIFIYSIALLQVFFYLLIMELKYLFINIIGNFL